VPFGGSYRPFWLGLGAVSFDLMLAVVITSLARRRLGYGAWRATHWTAYASWPVALIHGLGIGTDAGSTWSLLITLACLVTVGAAVAARLAGRDANGDLDLPRRPPGRARPAPRLTAEGRR
jgi:sulfoxide reductase heme-binding subunit YedZ